MSGTRRINSAQNRSCGTGIDWLIDWSQTQKQNKEKNSLLVLTDTDLVYFRGEAGWPKLTPSRLIAGKQCKESPSFLLQALTGPSILIPCNLSLWHSGRKAQELQDVCAFSATDMSHRRGAWVLTEGQTAFEECKWCQQVICMVNANDWGFFINQGNCKKKKRKKKENENRGQDPGELLWSSLIFKKKRKPAHMTRWNTRSETRHKLQLSY